ncbi:MAG TPA: ABC transporter permease [Gemmatimonadota bacterium]|nr:ABC transporter permease [Gemmatimonadota bacterium]
MGVLKLARSPGLAVFAAVAMGLGIGATATMFSLTHAGLQSMPFHEPDDLVVFSWDRPRDGRTHIGMTVQEVADYRQRQSTLQGLAGYVELQQHLSDTEAPPERIGGAMITANAFPLLGIQPFLGRGFSPDEERPGAEGVAIISHGLWSRRYGGDPDVLGQSIRVDGVDRVLVGVMPEGFRWPEQHDLWIPLEVDPTDQRSVGVRGITVFGRLKGGIALDEARSEFTLLARQLELAEPHLYDGLVLRAVTYYDYEILPDAVIILIALLVVVSLVLLIACGTVAKLLLAQVASRTRELAVRAALGASRGRLMGQVLVESLAIAALGGILGVGLTYLGASLIQRGMGADMPYYWMIVRVNPVVLAFVLTLVLLSGLVAGVVPGLRASRVDVHETLKDHTHASTGIRLGRLNRSLVVAEVALSCCLLTVAGLIAKGPVRWMQTNPGFVTEGFLTGRITLRSRDYPEQSDLTRFHTELLERLGGLPGVRQAVLASSLPGTQSSQWNIQVEGVAYESDRDLPSVRVRVVTPGFFRTIGVGAREGRLLSESDHSGAEPVIVVNQPFAERFFHGESPLGRRIRAGRLGDEGPWMTIVGVVPDLRMNANQPHVSEGMYLPMAQRPQRYLSLLLQTSGDPLSSAEGVRRTVAGIDRDLPVYGMASLAEALSRGLGPIYTVTVIMVVCGVTALVMAAAGLFGLLAFSVRCRTREIGIRMALGAEAGRILVLTLKDGMIRIGLGLAVGMGLAVICAPLLSELYAGTNPVDLSVYGLVGAVLAATGLVASVLPALMAVRVDPIQSLRSE